ncbi:MAG: class I SAM-dependent rRNA methyltransferase [Gemmatimonadales bacterium]|nr:class I SAM-dependent rRNA methyltransferase [Gemmatimonadota bacterium]MBK7784257.1 class I SAM-dependent rRNA methyltransferase [Gemmatimonadota bacterium]MBP6668888.1 class I SAM-dependent rRNA methyltransferase [Gemmatimonadales bacterium]MBP9200316.1 class I SAM-dependent rRNA methyltransferase [Gemmatimonadales bacterium]
MSAATARVSDKGAARWAQGHPWIYRSDVLAAPAEPGITAVQDRRGRFLGTALVSPRSEIRLRLLERSDRPVDGGWWREQLARAVARRAGIDATAWRVVHGEGDGLPSLVIDRYDRWVVAQLLSAGLETQRPLILEAIQSILAPEGILLRNDVGVRRHEGLPEETELVAGSVPETIEVREGPVRYLAAPWTGQKTGAFLDQRPNRVLAAGLTRPGGTALDCFTYHGSFALHLATHAARVTAVDASAAALARGRENAALNGRDNIEWVEADAFELLRSYEREKRRFDVVVVDPPAFAKTRGALAQAVRGYKELNLRAMRLLAPGGTLVSASCSFHLRREHFYGMLEDAARDSGRQLALTHQLGQGADHPEIVTIPETGYLKGAALRAC